MGTAGPVEASDDRILGQHIDCNLMRDPEPEPPSEAASEFLTPRNPEKVRVRFKPLRWGGVGGRSRTAAEDQCTSLSRAAAWELPSPDARTRCPDQRAAVDGSKGSLTAPPARPQGTPSARRWQLILLPIH